MFPDRLRATRIYRKYTQQEVADIVGIAVRSYQNYEGGSRQPEYAILTDIADCLAVSVDFLLGRDEFLQAQGIKVDIPLDVPPRRGQK